MIIVCLNKESPDHYIRYRVSVLLEQESAGLYYMLFELLDEASSTNMAHNLTGLLDSESLD